MQGTVVIGEGEMDQAPMLYIGEKLGTGTEPLVDVAVDPLEGTSIVAQGTWNALAVIAIADKVTCCMHQICICKKLPLGQRLLVKLILTLRLTIISRQ